MKKFMLSFVSARIESAIQDNEEGAGTGEGVTGTGEGGTGAGTGAPKTFTQEEVNKIVTGRVATMKSQLSKVEQNLSTALEEKGLSEETRARLQADLENVQAQMRTKEEQLKHEKKKLEEKSLQELRAAQQERDQYKHLFESSTIERSIKDAAVKNDGYGDGEQFVTFLKDKAKLVPELDALGNKTGNLVPMIEWKVKGDDGIEQVALKKPEEVIVDMKENVNRFGNMFKSNIAKGIGGRNDSAGASGGSVNVKNLTPEQYAELRKTPTGRKALGLQ